MEPLFAQQIAFIPQLRTAAEVSHSFMRMGINSVMTSVRASPRDASRLILQSQNEEDSAYNSLFMQWGQFVAHDITRTVDFEDGRRYSCDRCSTASTCSQIPVSRNDPK